MTAIDTFEGPISSNESRFSIKWFTHDSIVAPSNLPGPGRTLDSQWDIGTKKISLYNITSEPWHNMQDVTFLCEFDSSTNLAPGPGGTDPLESPETDPLEYVGPDKTYAEWYQVASSGVATEPNTFNMGTIKRNDNDNTYIIVSGTLNPSIDTNSGLYIKQYWLRIMNEGNNKGYYPIVSNNNSSNNIIIDPLGPYGALSTQSGLDARIYRFKRGDGSGVVNQNNDIQIDLQSGRYYAHLYLHAWPSYWNDNKLHTFKITPYYLTKSQLDSSDVIPVWSFTCKSVVQEIDLPGATFENYWGNFPT